jgi:hypothetical protein
LKKYLKIGLGVVALFAVVAAVAFFIYWQYLKTTPQYSLASLVDAAKRDDSSRVDELVDSDAVVEDMLPQVLAKAVDRYGRGVPPTILARAVVVTTPFLPAVKQRVRPEVPGLIRKETLELSGMPFPLLVLGAERYLDVQVDGDKAIIKKKGDETPSEIRMERNGSGWKVTGFKDEKFAGDLAQRVGQEILSLTSGRNGINVNSLMEQLQGPVQ